MKHLFFLAAVAWLASSGASAKPPPVKLDELVKFSDFIFVGRIHTRGDEPVLRGSFNTWGRLQIDVEHTICGGFFKEEWPDGRVEVLYPLNPIERPSFDPGDRYLFFWKDGYSGPQLAPSFYGAARFESELVHMEPVSDVGRSLPLKELEGMIDCHDATGSKELFRSTPRRNATRQGG